MPKGIYQHKPQQGFQKGHKCFTPIGSRDKKEPKRCPVCHCTIRRWADRCKKHRIFTEKHRNNLGSAIRGSKNYKGSEAKKGIKNPMFGKSSWNKNKVMPRGEMSNNWKGGITPENHRIRKSIESRLWREVVFARDNWTCQKYYIRGCKLHPHHIQNFSQFPELRFAIDNGITLSEKAHREFHRKYGIKNNTKEQLNEFLIN